jgi:hypothetical protein
MNIITVNERMLTKTQGNVKKNLCFFALLEGKNVLLFESKVKFLYIIVGCVVSGLF